MALADKKTPRKFIKGRTDGLIDSAKITAASSSVAEDIFSQDPAYVDGHVTPILYQTDLMQEDIDELRRYVTNDISGGGGGLTNSPLANVSGRFQWSSADDGERIHIGNTSYGPFNWYSHTSEPSFSNLRTYSKGTVNSTTATVYEYHNLAYGIYVPDESKKVKARVTFRIQGGNTFGFGFSMWDCAPPTDGQTANSTITLRAASDSTTANTDSTKTYVEEFTTTNTVSNKTLYFLAENRSGALAANVYMYFNVQFYLVD